MTRSELIIQDIIENHLPRVIEGLRLGYVDENQILVIYDHAVRARILKEVDGGTAKWSIASSPRTMNQPDGKGHSGP